MNKENSMWREMSLQEMKEVNGGLLPVAVVFAIGVAEGIALGISLAPALWESMADKDKQDS